MLRTENLETPRGSVIPSGIKVEQQSKSTTTLNGTTSAATLKGHCKSSVRKVRKKSKSKFRAQQWQFASCRSLAPSAVTPSLREKELDDSGKGPQWVSSSEESEEVILQPKQAGQSNNRFKPHGKNSHSLCTGENIIEKSTADLDSTVVDLEYPTPLLDEMDTFKSDGGLTHDILQGMNDILSGGRDEIMTALIEASTCEDVNLRFDKLHLQTGWPIISMRKKDVVWMFDQYVLAESPFDFSEP